MKLPDVSDKLVTAGLIVVAESPEYFGEIIRGDYAKYGKLVRDIASSPSDRRHLLISRILAALLALSLARGALAWGPEGHRMVGDIAERFLAAETRAQIQKLLEAIEWRTVRPPAGTRSAKSRTGRRNQRHGVGQAARFLALRRRAALRRRGVLEVLQERPLRFRPARPPDRNPRRRAGAARQRNEALKWSCI